MTNIDAIKKYVFIYASSNMYIIVSNQKALIIDPNISVEAMEYLLNEKVSEIVVLLTHEHYDHTSGLNWICSKFKSTVICHSETARSLREGKNNRPIVIASRRMITSTSETLKELVHDLPQGYKYDADITFSDTYSFIWEEHKIHMVSLPGHSKGGCCIEIDDNVVATGDLLIYNTSVITRFPGGSEEEYKKYTVPYLDRISDNTLIIPGHGNVFYMKEMRKTL